MRASEKEVYWEVHTGTDQDQLAGIAPTDTVPGLKIRA